MADSTTIVSVEPKCDIVVLTIEKINAVLFHEHSLLAFLVSFVGISFIALVLLCIWKRPEQLRAKKEQVELITYMKNASVSQQRFAAKMANIEEAFADIDDYSA